MPQFRVFKCVDEGKTLALSHVGDATVWRAANVLCEKIMREAQMDGKQGVKTKVYDCNGTLLRECWAGHIPPNKRSRYSPAA